MKQNNYLILERLLKSLFKIDCFAIVHQYLNYIDKMREKNGLAYTIKHMKVVKLHITRFICNKPLKSNSTYVSLDKDYFPSRFLYLKRFCKTNPDLVLTLLSYTRALTPNKKETNARKVDISSIIDPYKGKDYTIPIWFIKDFISHYGLSLSKPVYSNADHYLSVKGSPNGKSSMSSLWSVASHNENTLEYIRTITGEFFTEIYNYYTKIVLDYNHLIDNNKKILGKLSVVHDPELKERVIAMVDYTTQFTLKPIHNQLLNLLSKLDCDRTFTQDPFHNWQYNSENFHSLDLSAATDRFPIDLQEKLLSYIYDDKNFANSWRNLLVDRDFIFEQKSVKYSVGQPMGAYTSWAAFTLTHHLVVHWAAKLCGLDHFNQYIILGDDIVIKNNKVANKYITIMTRLGVDISQPKTHISKDTYEFAKRWIQKGREISGLSLKGILNNFKNKHVVYMNIFNYYLRRPHLDIDLLNLIGDLYKGIKVSNRVKSKSTIIKLLYDFHHSIRFSFNLLSYEDIRKYLNNKIVIEEFNVWPESLIPYKLREILSYGMVPQAESLKTNISKQMNVLRESKNIPIHLLVDWPLTYGFKNHIESMTNLIEGFVNKTSQLLDIISHLRLNNLDGIMKSRLNNQDLLLLDKLWKDSFSRYILALKTEREEILNSSEDKPKDLVSHIWGMARATTPIVYKTSHVGLKSFELSLYESFDSLNTDLEYLRLETRVDESSTNIQDGVHSFVYDSVKNEKHINWDEFM
nr:putative RNA-dependent RNA polymerase [Leptosphaeria biglobosa mitovirus 1]